MTREEIQDHVPKGPSKGWEYLCSPKDRKSGAGHIAITVSKPEALPIRRLPCPGGLNDRDVDHGMAAKLKEGFDGPRHPKMA